MTVMTEALRTTWQALNPREPKPSFLIAFFFAQRETGGRGQRDS